MRVINCDKEFKQWLLKIGDGKYSIKFKMDNDIALLPTEFLSTVDRIMEIYGDCFDNNNVNKLCERFIPARKKNDVLNINNDILNRMQGDVREYLSVDSCQDDIKQMLPIEFLNSLTPNGLPPHKLRLKVGAAEIISGKQFGKVILIP
ncbi:uncharacterized protein LOC116416074 [Nasonia vitripennis]|uniref:DNA helicase Pif1-like 2B domain-containing protein n=1 Tax=Nasonia vitripennis TaxID=7425 RepID=A0A7M7T6R0_NASVI|nr:uncharacterized protein LOC116416074 [Nasonia vitripennis]